MTSILKDLPKPLQPYYEDLLKAKSKTELLSALVKLLQEEEKLSETDKKKLLEMRLNTPMGRHKRVISE